MIIYPAVLVAVISYYPIGVMAPSLPIFVQDEVSVRVSHVMVLPMHTMLCTTRSF